MPESTEPTLLAARDVAEQLGIPVSRLHQLIRDRQVLATRINGVLHVPAEFLAADEVLKGLPGTLTVLTDAGFSDDEIVEWLYAPDESLPGRPIDALRENRGTEVRRRAQAAGF